MIMLILASSDVRVPALLPSVPGLIPFFASQTRSRRSASLASSSAAKSTARLVTRKPLRREFSLVSTPVSRRSTGSSSRLAERMASSACWLMTSSRRASTSLVGHLACPRTSAC